MRPPGLRSDWSELVWRGHLRAPLRHAAVSLHRLQMRSPAHALRNGDRQIRHFLIFCSVDRADSDFSCVPPAAEPRSSDVLFTSGKGFALSLRLLTLWSISRRPACLPLLSIAKTWTRHSLRRLQKSDCNVLMKLAQSHQHLHTRDIWGTPRSYMGSKRRNSRSGRGKSHWPPMRTSFSTPAANSVGAVQPGNSSDTEQKNDVSWPIRSEAAVYRRGSGLVLCVCFAAIVTGCFTFKRSTMTKGLWPS
jgi:hypothetical protein